MPGIRWSIPGKGWYSLGEHCPALSLGRAASNDIVLPDAGLSRHHARLSWDEGGAWIEDLGSRNGSLLNGERISSRRQIQPGDLISLGHLRFRLEAQTPLNFEDQGSQLLSRSMVIPIQKARRFDGGQDLDAQKLRSALEIIHDLSLSLMREEPLQDLLEDLLDRITRLLKPDRCAILLRGERGELQPMIRRSQEGPLPLQISRTMVEAALERHEAMLSDTQDLDPRLAQAESFVASNVISVMTVPLEYQGDVAGLLYLDAKRGRPPFMEEDLQLVASLGHLAAAKIQQERVSEALHRKRILEHELALARQIQLRLLPHQAPEVPGFSLLGHNRSCHEVSGDLFGYWLRRDGRIWIVIADVAGKGMGAGLLMATFQAFMSAWSEDTDSPSAMAQRISVALAHRTRINHYITAFLLLLDPGSNTSTSTSAGHNPALLLRGDGNREELPAEGFPLGLFPGTPYRESQITWRNGDLLFLYTDGISEAESPEGEEFGLGTAENLLRAKMGDPLPALKDALEVALDEHMAHGSLNDDQTLVLLRKG